MQIRGRNQLNSSHWFQSSFALPRSGLQETFPSSLPNCSSCHGNCFQPASLFFLAVTNPVLPFSLQGLVLGAPEACSQSPSSQPSRGLLPCTAPQPQPPQQPPPQPQGLPAAAQQQPPISSHLMSQVSPCRVPRAHAAPWAHRWEAEAACAQEGALGSQLLTEDTQHPRLLPAGQ